MTKICFIIAPIGSEESDTRKRSDQILTHVVRPAVEGFGYETVRADKISEPGLITTQVIQHIVDDPLVIADLTERNPNVFYELAIRHAIRKPLVQIIRKGEAIPFDVAAMRTIELDHRDLDSVAFAIGEIKRQVETIEKENEEIVTPISISVDLQSLRQSDNPQQRSLADLLSAISEMRGLLMKSNLDPSVMTDLLKHLASTLAQLEESIERMAITNEKVAARSQAAVDHQFSVFRQTEQVISKGAIDLGDKLSSLEEAIARLTSKFDAIPVAGQDKVKK